MSSIATFPSPTPTLPERDDEGKLFARWQRHGDESAREALVRRYLPLANRLARRYMRSSEPYEDLQQVASLGLLKALDRFDPSRCRPFQSFAIPTMLGEMRRHFRDAGWSIHVPRGAQERALKVRDAQEAFANEHGRAPTVNQLAVYLELGAEEVIDALVAMQGYKTLSLDAPRPGEQDETAINYGDSVGEDDDRYELVELDATITPVLDRIVVNCGRSSEMPCACAASTSARSIEMLWACAAPTSARSIGDRPQRASHR
jgi:RNA polymerase sigma-B factor